MLPVEIYQAHQTRAIDRIVIERHGVAGIELMRRAGRAAFARVMERYAGASCITVVCGPGNNGGDGYVLARLARRIGIEVTVLAAAAPGSADAITAADDYQRAGGGITVIDNDSDFAALDSADLIIDALFGTGLTRAPQGVTAALIRRINRAPAPVVALDMPSGLHSDTGFAFAPCVAAEATVTFIGVKLGLTTGHGRAVAGEILFEGLNIPTDARDAVTPAARVIAPPMLPSRARDAHKGDAGRVLVVGGGRGMLGAALLAGEAALRGGGGLVTVAGPKERIDWPALACAELMSADAAGMTTADIARADAVVLGPGLGMSDWGAQVFARFIQVDAPMVVDADGLNHLARAGDVVRRSDWILTPHTGEAARLLRCQPADIAVDRPAAARAIADKFGGICVLKGAGTLVAAAADAGAESGAESPLLVCDRGNPGMASAGMGDVLSGITGALLAQGLPALEAAPAAVWLHSAAADVAAADTGQRGLLARDVIARLPKLLRDIEAADAREKRLA